ncbi:hypothetical protein EC988_000661, partial [Linderina pennispora]
AAAPDKGESTTRVGFNVLNAIVGSGIVCLPYALHNAGFFFGVFMLVVIAGLSQFTLYALVRTGARTGTAHFSSVTEAALGRFGYHALNISMLVDMLGTVILYLMLIGDLVESLVQIYAPVQISRGLLLSAIAIVVILPLLFFRNTGPLAQFSIVSVLCLPYIIMVVAMRAPLYAGESSVNFDVFGPRILPAMGVLAFTYSSCHAAFPNFLGLRDRSIGNWVRASAAATTGATAISMAFAVTGFLAFGSSAQANVLMNFPDTDNWVNFGRLLFAVTMVLTTPMAFYPVRDTLTEILKIDPERHAVSTVYESTCTVVVFAMCTAVAIVCRDLGLAYELIGSLTASVINFVLPGLVYLCAGTDVSLGMILSRQSLESAPLLGGIPVRLTAWSLAKWVVAWMVVLFGFWIMVLGTYNILATA